MAVQAAAGQAMVEAEPVVRLHRGKAMRGELAAATPVAVAVARVLPEATGLEVTVLTAVRDYLPVLQAPQLLALAVEAARETAATAQAVQVAVVLG